MRKEIILQEKLQNSSPPANKYIILYAAGGKLAAEGARSEECGVRSGRSAFSAPAEGNGGAPTRLPLFIRGAVTAIKG